MQVGDARLERTALKGGERRQEEGDVVSALEWCAIGAGGLSIHGIVCFSVPAEIDARNDPRLIAPRWIDAGIDDRYNGAERFQRADQAHGPEPGEDRWCITPSNLHKLVTGKCTCLQLQRKRHWGERQ